MSFSGQRVQTIVFREDDREWLQHNIDATKRLVSRLNELGVTSTERNGTRVFRGVGTRDIVEFLRDYSFESDVTFSEKSSRKELLVRYIESEARRNGIRGWNVSFFGRIRPTRGTIDLGLPEPLNLINRSRIASSPKGRASVNVLVGPKDRINDLPLDDDQWAEVNRGLAAIKGTHSDAFLLEQHEEFAGRGIGHLGVYAISKDSEPRRSSTGDPTVAPTKQRQKLGAVEDVIGLGLFLPKADETAEVEYISGRSLEDLTEAEREEIEAEAAAEVEAAQLTGEDDSE